MTDARNIVGIIRLTPQAESGPKVADRPARREAPDPELEVTPEMIEAGVRAFFEFDSRFEGEREAVIRIFQAMRAAQVARPCLVLSSNFYSA
jgi:hypothetical protein